jgi:hypothetical protein
MTTKRELLSLLDEVKYSEFFEALGNNKVVHHSLSKLRKDFIHRGDNEAVYNERCREFVNFYLDENGKLVLIPPKILPYLLFALLGVTLALGVYFVFFHKEQSSSVTQIAQNKTWEFSGTVKIITENGQEMPVEFRNNAYQTTQAYPSGTKFRLKLSHENSFYVYAFATDNTREISQIYPIVDGISVANTLLAIPTDKETDFIQMNTVKGTDILCLLYSQEKLNINQIKADLQQSSGTLEQRLKVVLGEKVSFEANFQTKTIEFSNQTDKSIFAVLMQISHQ